MNKETEKGKEANKDKETNKGKKHNKLVVSLLALLVFIPLSVFGYVLYQMYSIYDADSHSVDSAENTYETITVSKDITNILLIGVDARNKEEKGRADAIMIATIDEKHRTVKITSIARDTYVNIPTKNRKEKINHAYSYGDAGLLKETIESNFKIPISNYVRVNFTSFTEIIDALGGLKLDVKKDEIKELNKYIPECYEASLKTSELKYIEKEGVQILNGYQALSYSRIRKNDSAIERDRRQRAVIQSLMDEFSQINILEIPKLINTVTKFVTTDMKPAEIIKYAQKVLKMGNFDINQLEFPISEYSAGKIINGKGWVLTFNDEKCLPLLYSFIYGEGYDEYINKNDSYLNSQSSNSFNEYDEESDNITFNQDKIEEEPNQENNKTQTGSANIDTNSTSNNGDYKDNANNINNGTDISNSNNNNSATNNNNSNSGNINIDRNDTIIDNVENNKTDNNINKDENLSIKDDNNESNNNTVENNDDSIDILSLIFSLNK